MSLFFTLIKNPMKKILILLLTACLFSNIQAQEDQKKYTIDGYASFMQTVLADSIWLTQNMFHNRINFNWYPTDPLKVNVELRNRLVYGEMVTMNPFFGDQMETEDRTIDMSYNLVNKTSWVLNTMIDRAYVEYTLKKLQFTLGRQRINWGRTFAWNPNDIFNSYSYFDFDYEERIGADAFRAVYYTGVASQAELVASLGANDNMTYAGLYKFNKFNYDFQVFGAYAEDQDYIGGLGFEGFVKDVSLRGEASYFYPIENDLGQEDGVLVSFGLDKIFPNEYSVQAEFLYNSYAEKINSANMLALYDRPMDAKNLSFDKYSLFANISKPITPLISAGIGGMYFVEMNGYFINPSLTFSLKENLSLGFFGQYFSVESGSERTDAIILFGRLKQSF